MRLAVMHNLWFYNHLMERIRDVPQRAFCTSSGMRASCGFLSLRSLYSGNSAGASGYSRDGHAFLLPALLVRPVCCPERFTDCTAVRHRTAYDFGSPLRSVAVGVIRHRACAHLSFYHAVWRWSRAIDIPAVFRHTTSAGVVLSFYFRHPGGTGCRCTLLVWLLRAGSQRKTPCFFSWAGRSPSAHAQLLLGQFALTAAAMLPLCGAATCLAYLGSQLAAFP